ncbi:hypothetical protein FGE12_21655 [Aggregicoccus sp. 17bor-14]|uniref:fibrinogen-like YCDxxxxGGGW domain-containing protein n=1 Tax=Myxococcaceae TaxID=31 RepID=UPI00129CCDE8|nr:MULTISPECIES: fibrinogen-like YCDxxxxGGGW domain-containing protein [Myxococcaceae]MBF5045023.1 hypothetical protein [Simulacricoccus sp. 17bor-14]MRI90766.1 hypothetical protein [Aggregicoccus sp. 17bor-14]
MLNALPMMPGFRSFRVSAFFLLPLLTAACLAPPPTEKPETQSPPDQPAQPEQQTPPPTEPSTEPGWQTPVITSAVAGDGQVRLRWSRENPSRWYSYTVRTTDGSTALEPLTTLDNEVRLTGLVPGKPYAFTVTARTPEGTREATSEASDTVTPFVGSCRTLKQTQPDAATGLHTLTIGGRELQVYCNMNYDGGGWTLVLHSAFTGVVPAHPALTQGIAAWRSSGVGQATDYGGHRSAPLYVMPLDTWRELADGASTLRFESDATPRLAQLDDVKMAENLGLSGSNTTEVNAALCGQSPGCFLNFAPPFSTTDSDTSGSSCASVHRNIGWWYEGCHLYHPFMTDTRANFSGFSQDPTTDHWTWWLR